MKLAIVFIHLQLGYLVHIKIDKSSKVWIAWKQNVSPNNYMKKLE